MTLTTDHLKWVKAYVNRVKSPSTPNIDLEDIAQEGWIAMWKALEKANASGKTINEAYLKQAARWTVLNLLKKRFPDIPLEPSEIPDAVSFQPDRDVAAHQEEIWAAVHRLPDKQREYVLLRFWADWNTKTQLQATGYSTGLWHNPNSGAKVRLACELAHLRHLI